MNLSSNLPGTLSNTGLLSGTRVIIVGGDIGAFSNTGTITASVDNAAYIRGNMFGAFTNSGVISSASQAVHAGSIGGNVTNSGTISSGAASAFYVGGVGGTLANSGAISSAGGAAVMIGKSVV